MNCESFKRVPASAQPHRLCSPSVIIDVGPAAQSTPEAEPVIHRLRVPGSGFLHTDEEQLSSTNRTERLKAQSPSVKRDPVLLQHTSASDVTNRSVERSTDTQDCDQVCCLLYLSGAQQVTLPPTARQVSRHLRPLPVSMVILQRYSGTLKALWVSAESKRPASRPLDRFHTSVTRSPSSCRV